MSNAPKLCEDEGCPHFDTDHVCIDRDVLIKELVVALDEVLQVSNQTHRAWDNVRAVLRKAEEVGYGAG